MTKITRRALCGAVTATSLPLFVGSEGCVSANAKKSEPRLIKDCSLVHLTDLFRPHDDPDDHWDLATAYALAWAGDLHLAAVLTDNPLNVEQLPEQLASWNKDNKGVHVDRSPDVAAVAQLNYITDRAVPVMTGPVWPGKPGEKVRADNSPKDLAGVMALLDLLRRSPQPVSILTAGSCQNVALAGVTEPRLFAEKCAGIYLSAGTGSQIPSEQSADGQVEWNVGLNRGAYAAVFELPCPIYWMPCFHGFSKNAAASGEFGSNWYFHQREILPFLSTRLQTFFAYALSKECGTNWLSYLHDPTKIGVVQKFLDDERGMYSTPGFLHAAGKTVSVDGQLIYLVGAKETPLYEFVPIEIQCGEDGITNWRHTEKPTNRYIFRVADREKYRDAMVSALRSLLIKLP